MTMINDERDLVKNKHPEVIEHGDWQQRRLDAITSKIWHGADDDHGAMTRFGMGWGPLEVVRAQRTIKRDKGQHVYRTIQVYGGGVLRLTVTFSPTGRSFKIVDERERAGHVDTGQVDPYVAVQTLRDALCAVRPDHVPATVWDALEAVEKAVAG